jgi:hypothetical protein
MKANRRKTTSREKNLRLGLQKKRDSNQTADEPPNKSWLLPKSEPQIKQLKFTMKTQKRIFGIIWQCKNSKQRKNEFVSNTLALLVG